MGDSCGSPVGHVIHVGLMKLSLFYICDTIKHHHCIQGKLGPRSGLGAQAEGGVNACVEDVERYGRVWRDV